MKAFPTHFLFALSLICSLSFGADRIGPPIQEQLKIKKTTHSAEVLWSKRKMTINSDGHWQSTSYYSIRLNDLEAARDYGRINIAFNHYYSDTTLDFANVRSTDGQLSPVLDDAVQLRITGGGQDFYSDSSELVFSLSDIAPGSIIEFQFTTHSKILALASLFSTKISPYWFQTTVGGDAWRMDFVNQHTFEISHPHDLTIFTKNYLQYPLNPTVKQSGATITKRWKLSNAGAIDSENWMPSLNELAPSLWLSTHTDWSVVEQWA